MVAILEIETILVRKSIMQEKIILVLANDALRALLVTI